MERDEMEVRTPDEFAAAPENQQVSTEQVNPDIRDDDSDDAQLILTRVMEFNDDEIVSIIRAASELPGNMQERIEGAYEGHINTSEA